ncbi:nesprin-1-like [Sesbania bispinosa]|nr:nesprin-1-like [Sesbania bispinosa]
MVGSSSGPKLADDGIDTGKSLLPKNIIRPPMDMSEEDLYRLLQDQGDHLFKSKTPQEMKYYLGQLTHWCLGGVMMATFFKYVMDELHVLHDIKKNFEDVSAKLLSDEAKMKEALSKVQLMTEERDQLSAENVLLQQKLATEKDEKLKAESEITKATKTARKALEDLEAEKLNWKSKEIELRKEVGNVDGFVQDAKNDKVEISVEDVPSSQDLHAAPETNLSA